MAHNNAKDPKKYYQRVYEVLCNNEKMILFTFDIKAYVFAFKLMNEQVLKEQNMMLEYKTIGFHKYEIKICQKA